jgi:hypothetical protein
MIGWLPAPDAQDATIDLLSRSAHHGPRNGEVPWVEIPP